MLFPSIFRDHFVDGFFGNPLAFDHASVNAYRISPPITRG